MLVRTRTKRQKTDRQKIEAILDALYREFIRRRAIRLVGSCQVPGCITRGRCRTYHGLEAVHLHGRGRHTVRWDSRNGVGLCHDHHRYLDTHPIEKQEFFKKLLGEDEYWKLFQLANMTTKTAPVDYEKVETQLRKLLKEV